MKNMRLARISFRSRASKMASFFLLMLSWNGAYASVPATPFDKDKTVLDQPSSADASNRIVVKGFLLTGNTLITTEKLQPVLAGYLNQSCDLNMLREAAGRVTIEYQRQGYSLAKAYILQQNIVDGMVRVTVVEGKIGKIIVEGNKNYSSDFITRYLTSGKEQRGVTTDILQHGLLFLNSNFTDLKVSANFVPGKEPGTTDVHVKVDDSFPLHAILNTNNLGSRFVSRYRFGGQIEVTNVLTPGSLLTVGGFVGDQFKSMHIINGGYSLPLNSVGTIIGINANDGNFQVGKDFAELGIHNDQVSGDVFVKHPFIFDRKTTFFGKAGFRASNARYFNAFQEANNEPYNKDNIRALYVEAEGNMVAFGGRSLVSATLTQGMGGLFDGTKSGDVLTSRENASNEFTRVNLDFARLQPLSDTFSSLLRLSGQWSSTNLLAGEEWLIGGINSVHGYTAGEASGYQGYSASLALRANPLVNKEVLQLSVFMDYGRATKNNPRLGSKATTELTGVGAGVSSHFNSVSPTDIRVDIGWPLNPSTNFLKETPVLYFDASIRF